MQKTRALLEFLHGRNATQFRIFVMLWMMLGTLWLSEYFHRIITEGEEFKEEWLHYDSLPPLKKFEDIVTYNDPSFKGSITSDFKSIIAVGFHERRFWIIDIWCIQAPPSMMAEAHYDMHERLEAMGAENIEHWIEANFSQDELVDYYTEVGLDRKYNMYIREDKESSQVKKVEFQRW
jgi:hypothetical protein